MLDNFFAQLRDNARLRWGIALILGIAWLYGVLLLREGLQEQTQQHRTDAQAVARLGTQLAQPEWTTRAVSARAMAVQLEGRLWQAATPGLAQAAFQDWLRANLGKAGIVNPQISVAVIEDAIANPTADLSTAAAPTDLWKIKAKLGFEFSAPTLMDFLSQLENYEKQTVVGMLTARKEPSPRVEMELYGYFQKQASAGAKPGKEPAPL